MTLDPVIVSIARLAIAWLFIASAVHKLRSLRDFRSVLVSYRLLPDSFVASAAIVVPLVELAIGGAALAQYPLAYVAAGIALLGYAAAMTINLARGRRLLDCGCGGVAQPLSIALVVRNLVLAGVAWLSLSPVAARPLGWIDALTILLGAAVAGVVYAAANELMAARARLEEWV
jgi:uncharacterized membrane protein YphA (DoxX/SURF4 family)